MQHFNYFATQWIGIPFLFDVLLSRGTDYLQSEQW
jgi:hypothetical protein